MTYGKASLPDKRPFKAGDIIDMYFEKKEVLRLMALTSGQWNAFVLGYKYNFWVLSQGHELSNMKLDFFITRDTLKRCTVISSCT